MSSQPFWLLSLLFLCLAGAPADGSPSRDLRVVDHAPRRLISSHTGDRFKATAGADTFCLYGGPGSILGRFQDAGGNPDAQSWVGVDETESPPLWQRSTFNAENLNTNGAGNHAMWAGKSLAQEPGWASAPGYGDAWNALLEWRVPILDPGVEQTVQLEFYYNLETEPFFDFLVVAFQNTVTGLTETMRVTDTNQDGSGLFVAPGETYSNHATATITYGPGEYPNDEIRILILGQSDGAYSDEDGLFSTDAGLAQVDDITVTYSDGVSPQVSFEDFEGAGPYEWDSVAGPFAGQFGRVFPALEDIDPCKENDTPVWAFVDDGLGPYNATYTGTGTGGTTDSVWTYGPGGYVFPVHGGISQNLLSVSNFLESPEIDWDLPGPADDGADVRGAFLRFDTWDHLPFVNGIFRTWYVRGLDPDTGVWSNWTNRGFVYHQETPQWRTMQHDVTDLLPLNASKVQVRLEALDGCSLFGLSCPITTPAPYLDNVGFFKYQVGGPHISANEIYLLQDSFPNSGNLDLQNLADLSCRLDIANDISRFHPIVPGDSVVVDVASVLPGASVVRVDLKWMLDLNPVFDGVRSQPPGSSAGTGTGPHGWDQWFGIVTGEPGQSAHPIGNQYTFELPHDGPPNINAPHQSPEPAMFFPGDRLRYYIEAEDSAGRISTLPADLSGFVSGVGYPRTFTVHALPDIDSSGVPASVLYVAASGDREAEEAMLAALDEHLLAKTILPSAYDVYRVQAPQRRPEASIGSSYHHGATAAQLAPYRCIIYDVGHRRLGFGDGELFQPIAKVDDIALLTAWRALPGDRAIIYIGDHVVTAMRATSAGQAYADAYMGLSLLDDNATDDIGQTHPGVTPTLPGFLTPFALEPLCPVGTSVDAIQPTNGAPGHVFSPGGYSVYPSVIWSRQDGERWLVDATFAFSLASVQSVGGLPPHGPTRSEVVGDFLGLLEHTGSVGDVPSAGRPEIILSGNRPNPFNPSTTVHFRLGRRAVYTATVYNARGERVRRLWSDPLEAGPQEMVWNGRDDRGRSVASGIYVLEIAGDGQRQVHKMALLK